MHVPGHFAADDDAAVALMREYPLATLVVPRADGPVADPIPLLAVDRGAGLILEGHVARANPVWRDGDAGGALALFTGPRAYVSPGWYPSKHEHGRVVPTWNYAVVHAHGRIRFIDDAAWVRGHLERLTDRQEAAMPAPWGVGDAPAEFTARLAGAVVGLEFLVERLEAKFKLGQNRPPEDREGAIHALEALGGEAATTARAMRRVSPPAASP